MTKNLRREGPRDGTIDPSAWREAQRIEDMYITLIDAGEDMDYVLGASVEGLQDVDG